MKTIESQQKNLQKILDVLSTEGVIVCPTDTVYGLLADATNKKAVKKVFQIKKRSSKKPFPVFVKDIEMAGKLAIINKKQLKFLKKFWPGKVTVVLRATEEAKKMLAKGIIGEDNKIGLRIPDYKLVNKILGEFKKPLTATSANISGELAIIDIKDVISSFSGQKLQPDLAINEGKLKESEPSTVIDLSASRPKILREGALKLKL